MHASRARRELAPGSRIRVLVVDKSVMVRRLLAHALEADPLIEVVGAAATGTVALERIPQINPDVLTLDLEAGDKDGLDTLRRVRSLYPEMRVILISAALERGAPATLEALAQGVDDYVSKPPQEPPSEQDAARVRCELAPKIRQFFRVSAARAGGQAGTAPPTQFQAERSLGQAVVIGVSTGGPAALASILPSFPPKFALPILVVQHMPAQFTKLLANRLSGLCPFPVVEAAEGEPVRPGAVVLAAGDFHMRVRRENGRATIRLDQSPPENSCRPSVDVLFRSAGEVYGAGVLAAVLTGMGLDGLRGASTLKAVGATVLAQDEASSVVWGMPGAVATAGLADAILPLDSIVPEIVRRIRKT
ncbi:chemotaxis-specific protein-glutamate methyltransferase CheB [Paludibaculum fermentans]|uniref:Protein-glutamate methylesterase/protein-glutamine glutaminase n=1 Tax=Paludibaculum fermentans TaxID=1473598 RepID=A0A7S7NPR8_PALFE|nr:chemotaxis-specific protein-glutamate methyltransferase CheB [Paludibaculum fermentans]QOY87044.1 chemotaxis-specific protein-glutamate methyltransferase CheB [Paludibaculum fermentans]